MAILFDRFAHRVSQSPDKTAWVDFHTGQSWTYCGTLDWVQGVAATIQQQYAVSPGDRVGILLHNQVEWIIGFFALQALGVVAVPLSTRLTASELGSILDDAGIQGLITSTEFHSVYAPFLSQLSFILQADPGEAPSSPSQPCLSMATCYQPAKSATNVAILHNNAQSPQDLAVLLYTSGTTGKPKGVMLSHQNLIADAQANCQVVDATASDIFVTASPLFHVFGLTNMLLTSMLSGGTLVLVKRFNPKQLLEAISRHQVTFLAAVPTMYQMMLSFLPDANYDLSSLRVCHSGAAPMSPTVFHKIEAVFGAPVQEGYGQSEASSIMTANPLDGVRKPGSIGLPIPGLTLEIVDENNRVCPPGVVGELRAQGETVMLGYWQNPQATKSVIREGWLYTRDLGYRDEDGYIFLLGRQDDLMNIGGNKVYPQEVEAVLYQFPGVACCAVKGEASDLYHQVVAAYVVCQPDHTIILTDLQKFCRQHLTEYKVPKALYCIDEIPQSASGKILRHQL